MTRTGGRVALVTAVIFLLVTLWVVPFGDALAVDFDWSMPDRFGLDLDSDGVIDYRTTTESIGPPVGGWRVEFTTCGKGDSNFRWSVNGIESMFEEAASQVPTCRRFSHHFPKEGKYGVTLTASDISGGIETVTHEVTVQDWLIVAVGDSFGSGEGNPDVRVRDELSLGLFDAEQTAWTNYNDALRRQLRLTQQANHIVNVLWPNFTTAGVNLARTCSGNPLGADCLAAGDAFSAARSVLLLALADFGIDSIENVVETVNGRLEMATSATQVALAAWQLASGDLEAVAPVWKDRRCHRSALSGQALAALEIERNDPRTSVTFVHLACSGAKIEALPDEAGGGGLLDAYQGVEPRGQEIARENWIPSQMSHVAALIGDREVDALLVSIGGNDMKFTPTIMSCVQNAPCYDPHPTPDRQLDFVSNLFCNDHYMTFLPRQCSTILDTILPFESALAMFNKTRDGLYGRYLKLGARIESLGIIPERVYLTEYPNEALDDDGSYCDFGEEMVEDDPLDDSVTYRRMLPLVTKDELQWASENLVATLNGTAAQASADLHWVFVGGIFAEFGELGLFGHGYCAHDRWFVRLLPETFLRQGNMAGSAHPNEMGHQVYRDKIVAALNGAFYVNGSPGDGILQKPGAIPQFCSNCHASGGGGALQPRQSPVANAGDDRTVERTSADGAQVALDGSKSHGAEGATLTYLWTWNGGSTTGSNPTVILPPGLTTVTLTVSDGHLSSTDTCDVSVIDKTPPFAEILAPYQGTAIQGTLDLRANATDIGGIAAVQFFIRTPGGERGVPLGPVPYENLIGSLDGRTGQWKFRIDSTLLPDGHYVIFVKAVDAGGNDGFSVVVPFSIRNWAVAELFPRSERSNPGRTMPVKFTLRIDAQVDPERPFVHCEDLLVNIHEASAPNDILQTTVFGGSSTDYRVDDFNGVYITNFMTSRTPSQYIVDVYRRGDADWKVGSFSFITTR